MYPRLNILLFVILTFFYSPSINGQESNMSLLIKLSKQDGAFTELKKQLNNAPLSPVLEEFSLKPLFRGEQSKGHINTSRYWQLNYRSNATEKAILSMLNKLDCIEIAEPTVTFKVHFVPNDPLADPDASDNQNQLLLHDMYEVWDLEQGDTNVVIGVVDTGFNLDHEDLQDNLKINYNDLPDGINNDNDSLFGLPLIDNYRGWDVAEWDNDPSGADYHGAAVAGVSSATVDNNTGLAGIAYKCKYLPIKASYDASPSSVDAGYTGIIYAAEQGVDVINLSWGSPKETNAYSQILQDIINFAVLDKDAVVVASAGNTGTYAEFYPASFENVVSVTGIRLNNKKVPLSSYNYQVDMCSLGKNVYSAGKNNLSDSYGLFLGTSYAAPVVSGGMALIRSKYPDWNALQVAEHARITGDIIDTLPDNMPFKEQIGRKMNLKRALSDTLIPAVRLVGKSKQLTTSNLSTSRDTLKMDLRFINYLKDINELSITLASMSPGFIFLDSTVSGASIAMMDSLSVKNTFLGTLDQNYSNDSLLFRIGYQGENGYVDYEYFYININKNTIEDQLSLTCNTSLPQAGDSLVLNFLFQSKDEALENLKITVESIERNLLFSDSIVSFASVPANSFYNLNGQQLTGNVQVNATENDSLFLKFLFEADGFRQTTYHSIRFDDLIIQDISFNGFLDTTTIYNESGKLSESTDTILVNTTIYSGNCPRDTIRIIADLIQGNGFFDHDTTTWINVDKGVSISNDEKPFSLVLENYSIEDTIVVQYDIYNNSSLEQTVFRQYILDEYFERIVNGTTFNFTDGIKVYPNPADDFLTVANEGSKGFSATVYNLQGQPLIIEAIEGQSEKVLNIANLAPGLYVLEIKSDEIIREQFFIY